MMRWEKLQIQTRDGDGGHEVGPVSGPGKRWGHTCNAIRGGKLLYVFGGFGKNNCQTNQVHIFDTVMRRWSEPVMKGVPPTPRDSHSCTTVGDNLFVFGGTDGRKPLNDLHILDTSSNTWISPSLRGEGPAAREGHSAALVGKRLFIFGGCGKSSNNSDEEHYDDLYILNTETFVWKRAATSGAPPAKRDSHTCSSWKNKIIVVGGEDAFDYYMSDVHILDADTLVWRKLNTLGQLLPPRAGHTTVALGKNLFVFGGFSDAQNLYDDIHMIDVDTGIWTKVVATGEGPSSRFSMAGDCLDPEKGGVLAFIGGCNKNLEALDDMYYLYTGLVRENERDDRRLEKLSLRKQLKLKCQEQQNLAPAYDKALVRIETNTGLYQPMLVPTYIQPSRQTVYLSEYQAPPGKRTFQAKVTTSFADGYTIETVIDGKPLRGVLFSNKLSFNHKANDNSNRKRAAVEIGGVHGNGNKTEAKADVDIKNSATSDASHSLKVPGNSELPKAPSTNSEEKETSEAPNCNSEVPKDNTPATARDTAMLSADQDCRAVTTEERNPMTSTFPPQSV